MTEPGLIAAYLTALQYAVARLADVDDILVEPMVIFSARRRG